MSGRRAEASGPRPMRADARRNFERLLAEASLAFAERGAEASLDDIAKRAGVGNATLYRHFPTREALLETVYRDEIQQLSDQATRVDDSASPTDALIDWLRTAVAKTAVHNGLKGLLGIVLRDEGAELGSWCRDTITSSVGVLLLRAQQTGEVRADLTPLTVLRLVNAISIASEMGGGDQAEQLLMLVVDGLRSR
jgi:AcrR family transcriptional regulator